MIPESLKIKNFLSHDESEIDFNKFDVALVLGQYDNELDQSNGAGKSAIFEAISWALFGKSRHKKIDGVVKWDCRACRVEFVFLVDDIKYRIIRTRDKIIRDSDVTFEQWDGSQFDSIDCDTNTATDKKIVETIKVNYEVFINSVYFKQNDISMFATTTPSKRKDVLKSLLKMEMWDEYQKKARERAKVLSGKIEEKEQHMVPTDELNQELGVCKQEVLELKKQIKEVDEQYSNLNEQLINKRSSFSSFYNNADGAIDKLKAVQKEFTEAKARVQHIADTRSKNNDLINQNTSKIAELNQKINLFKDQIRAKNKVDIDKLRNKMIEGRTKEKVTAEQIEALKTEVKLSGECDVCGKTLTKSEAEDIRKKRKDELRVAQDKYSDLKVKLAKAEALLAEHERVVVAGNKAEIEKGKAEIKIAKMQDEINSCINTNTVLEAERDKIKARDFKREISELKLKTNKDNQEKLQAEIEELSETLSGIKKKGDKFNVEYGSKVRRRNEIIKIQQEQEGLQKDIDKLRSEYSMYDKLRGYFGKDGIQSVIIENVIEELENYANDTLSKICNEPTSISIKTQKQNENGSWTETFDILVKAGARSDDFETFSGGEQFRISLALRLALSNILSKRMGGVLKFLLLDEVSSNLDNKGLDMFINIVKQLGEELKILVITHDEKLKERFEDIILVRKGPNGSQATFQ